MLKVAVIGVVGEKKWRFWFKCLGLEKEWNSFKPGLECDSITQWEFHVFWRWSGYAFAQKIKQTGKARFKEYSLILRIVWEGTQVKSLVRDLENRKVDWKFLEAFTEDTNELT